MKRIIQYIVDKNLTAVLAVATVGLAIGVSEGVTYLSSSGAQSSAQTANTAATAAKKAAQAAQTQSAADHSLVKGLRLQSNNNHILLKRVVALDRDLQRALALSNRKGAISQTELRAAIEIIFSLKSNAGKGPIIIADLQALCQATHARCVGT